MDAQHISIIHPTDEPGEREEIATPDREEFDSSGAEMEVPTLSVGEMSALNKMPFFLTMGENHREN